MTASNDVQTALAAAKEKVVVGGIREEREKRERMKGKRNEGGITTSIFCMYQPKIC